MAWVNLMFCFLAAFFMGACEDNRVLFWLSALSFVVNFAAFAMLV